jgi:hypothetical protein
MTLKLLSIAAFSLMLAGGAAIAQTNTDTSADPNAAGQTNSTSAADPGPKYLGDPAKMAVFFTDDTMTTMRSADEMKTAWMAMSEEDRTKMQAECETTDSIKYKEFCGAIGNM